MDERIKCAFLDQEEFKLLLELLVYFAEFTVKEVYTNHDYEPYAFRGNDVIVHQNGRQTLGHF